jgi:hypothetical protein
MSKTLMHITVVLSAVLVLLASATTSFVLYNAFQNGHKFRADQAKVWHDVLCATEAEVRMAPKLTAEQREKALLFYDRLLVLAHADPCPPVS